MLDVLLERQGAIATITLNRPERRNALSLDMMLELIEVLNGLRLNPGGVGANSRGGRQVIFFRSRLTGNDGAEIPDYRRIFDVCTELMTASKPSRSQ